MLKRCQVLLDDWQEEYIKDAAERYDVSFSEVVRIFLSEGFIQVIHRLNPEYKTGVTLKQFAKMATTRGKPSSPIEEQRKFIGEIYFEARKAVEYRLSKVRNNKKK